MRRLRGLKGSSFFSPQRVEGNERLKTFSDGVIAIIFPEAVPMEAR